MGRHSSESQQLWCGAPQCCGLEREMGGPEKDFEEVIVGIIGEESSIFDGLNSKLAHYLYEYPGTYYYVRVSYETRTPLIPTGLVYDTW